MSANLEVVKKFYDAFAKRDGVAMGECYSDNVKFSDPVFPNLVGKDARAMWLMLCTRSKDLRIEYKIVTNDGSNVVVDWDAWYTFTKTGRMVHNIIRATLTVENGKIVRHVDKFSFWRWTRQALGPVGLILGWTPIIKNKIRQEAAKGLATVK